MQIFRVSEDHEISAKFLDNRRLSKQVLELYQIINVCLAKLGYIKGDTRYLNHPIVKHVFNNGQPYLLDAYQLLLEMDKEHKRRGGKRSLEFEHKIQTMVEVINLALQDGVLSNEKLPPFYVYGDCKLLSDKAYLEYQKLLYLKWAQDNIAPRCNVRR